MCIGLASGLLYDIINSVSQEKGMHTRRAIWNTQVPMTMNKKAHSRREVMVMKRTVKETEADYCQRFNGREMACCCPPE